MGKSFEVDRIDQWLEIIHEPFRRRPWCIVVTGYVRAEFELEADARHVVESMRSVWQRYVDQGAPQKKQRRTSTAPTSGDAENSATAKETEK
jgi:hypothetical protein